MKTLEINTSGKPAIFTTPLSFIPEAPEELNIRQTEYWYRICQLLIDNGLMNHIKRIYLKGFLNDLEKLQTAAPDSWLANQLPELTAEQQHEINKSVRKKMLETEAELLGVSLEQINDAGVPVGQFFQPLERENNEDYQQTPSNDGSERI